MEVKVSEIFKTPSRSEEKISQAPQTISMFSITPIAAGTFGGQSGAPQPPVQETAVPSGLPQFPTSTGLPVSPGGMTLPTFTAPTPQGTTAAPPGLPTLPTFTAPTPQGTTAAPPGLPTLPTFTAPTPQGTTAAPGGMSLPTSPSFTAPTFTAPTPQGTTAAPPGLPTLPSFTAPPAQTTQLPGLPTSLPGVPSFTAPTFTPPTPQGTTAPTTQLPGLPSFTAPPAPTTQLPGLPSFTAPQQQSVPPYPTSQSLPGSSATTWSPTAPTFTLPAPSGTGLPTSPSFAAPTFTLPAPSGTTAQTTQLPGLPGALPGVPSFTAPPTQSFQLPQSFGSDDEGEESNGDIEDILGGLGLGGGNLGGFAQDILSKMTGGYSAAPAAPSFTAPPAQTTQLPGLPGALPGVPSFNAPSFTLPGAPPTQLPGLPGAPPTQLPGLPTSLPGVPSFNAPTTQLPGLPTSLPGVPSFTAPPTQLPGLPGALPGMPFVPPTAQGFAPPPGLQGAPQGFQGITFATPAAVQQHSGKMVVGGDLTYSGLDYRDVIYALTRYIQSGNTEKARIAAAELYRLKDYTPHGKASARKDKELFRTLINCAAGDVSPSDHATASLIFGQALSTKGLYKVSKSKQVESGIEHVLYMTSLLCNAPKSRITRDLYECYFTYEGSMIMKDDPLMRAIPNDEIVQGAPVWNTKYIEIAWKLLQNSGAVLNAPGTGSVNPIHANKILFLAYALRRLDPNNENRQQRSYTCLSYFKAFIDEYQKGPTDFAPKPLVAPDGREISPYQIIMSAFTAYGFSRSLADLYSDMCSKAGNVITGNTKIFANLIVCKCAASLIGAGDNGGNMIYPVAPNYEDIQRMSSNNIYYIQAQYGTLDIRDVMPTLFGHDERTLNSNIPYPANNLDAKYEGQLLQFYDTAVSRITRGPVPRKTTITVASSVPVTGYYGQSLPVRKGPGRPKGSGKKNTGPGGIMFG